MAQNNQNNQNSGGGNNNRNANRNQGANAPEIKITAKSASQIIGDTCEVSFEVSVFRGQNPVQGQLVILKDGLARITRGDTEVLTDQGGIAMLKAIFDLQDQEQHKVLRICLDRLPNEISYPLDLPKKEKVQGPKEPSEKLVVMKYQKDNGEVTCKFRVLDTDGLGVKDKAVNIFFKGVDRAVVTDSEGEKAFTLPETLEEGEETSVFFSVSGIDETLEMKLRRKKPLNQAKAFSRGWWLGVNNGRAFCLFLLAIFFWILAISIGPGRPIFSPGLFSGSDGLTFAQENYNKTASEKYKVKPADRSKDYVFERAEILPKKSLWKIALFLTVALFIYFPIAAREEIVDALEDIKLKMVDRKIVSVQDPFFERLVASASSLGMIGGKKNQDVRFGPTASSDMGTNPNDKDGDGKKDKPVFGSSFLSYLSLDLATDLVTGVVKRVFRRR